MKTFKAILMFGAVWAMCFAAFYFVGFWLTIGTTLAAIALWGILMDIAS